MSAAPGSETGGDGISVEIALTADPELFGSMARLLPQLSTSADPLTAYELEGIIESPATTLFVARDSGHDIVGALTLVVFRAPTGVRGWIEDVVVDESVRGAGIGSAVNLLDVEAVGGLYQPLRKDDLRPRGALIEGAEPQGPEPVPNDRVTPEELRGVIDELVALAVVITAELENGAIEPRPASCTSRGGCMFPTICRCEYV